MEKRKSILWMVICLVCGAVFLGGCSRESIDKEKKKEVDYTVIGKEELPKKLQKEIKKRQEKPCSFTWENEGYIYLIKGYGKKEMSGYSVRVDELWESDTNIFLKTSLEGPREEEATLDVTTYPVLVIKIENRQKEVLFE